MRLLAFGAQRGCPEAIGILGVVYRDGCGVPVNMEKAMELLSQAAELGSASARWELGECYLRGQGVERDTARGLQLLTSAAKIEIARGDTVFPYMLGCAYAEGKLVTRDDAKAEEWWQSAATYGDEMAAAKLKLLAAPLTRR